MKFEEVPNLYCEVLSHSNFPRYSNKATHVYGPECEVESGKLMYLCALHAKAIREWLDANPNQPVECPNHGVIGIAKNYVILKEIN